MEPRIEILAEKKLAGKKTTMSFAENKTGELWRSFMPRRKELNSINSDLYSIEVYPSSFFSQFNPNTPFEKWAAVEVENIESVSSHFETITIPSGLYAVFLYKGSASTATATYQYIFAQWIPASKYSLDHRPHFAVMGDKYKNEDPDSEEELWIPIRPKE